MHCEISFLIFITKHNIDIACFREEDANFSTPCETDLGVIPLPSSTNYDEIHVPPSAESPTFNADLEYLFSADQNGDVLSMKYITTAI